MDAQCVGIMHRVGGGEVGGEEGDGGMKGRRVKERDGHLNDPSLLWDRACLEVREN